MRIDRYLDTIIGSESRFPLSDRILNAALFLSMLVGIITVSMDYFGNLMLQTKLISTSLYLVVVVLYFIARKHPGNSSVKIAFLVFQFTGIIYIWYFFDGVSGISNVYIISFLFIISLITKGRVRIILLTSFFLIALTIFLIEMAHPDIIVNYKTSRSENIDTFLSTLGIAAGIVFMTLIVIHSYTQKQKQVEELNRSKDSFLSIIAHDLKNPIANLASLSEYLMRTDETNDPAAKKKLEEAIYTTSKNTFSLLENILLWARSETGLIEAEIQDINIHSVIKETLSLLKEQAANKSITISNDVEQDMKVKADLNMANLMCRNIVSNAIKFTNNGGVILISAKRDSRTKMVTFSIKDNGIGIKKELISHLFDLDNTYQRMGTNNESGTGLGLKLCKEFADKQNGNIWVESEPGKGSTFCISLPAG
ncbi:sensor histidine kinase [Bacteroidota bacterium]